MNCRRGLRMSMSRLGSRKSDRIIGCDSSRSHVTWLASQVVHRKDCIYRKWHFLISAMSQVGWFLSDKCDHECFKYLLAWFSKSSSKSCLKWQRSPKSGNSGLLLVNNTRNCTEKNYCILKDIVTKNCPKKAEGEELNTVLNTFQPENAKKKKQSEAQLKKVRAYKTKKVYWLLALLILQ